MAELINLAGTLSHSFTIGQNGVTVFHGLANPQPEMGNVGDIYIQTHKEVANTDDIDDVSAESLAEYKEEWEGVHHESLPVNYLLKYTGDNNATYYIWNGTTWSIAFSGHDTLGRVYHKENVDGTPQWVYEKKYEFDEDIFNVDEDPALSGIFKVKIESADNSKSLESQKETDYRINHTAYGVTRYATNDEAVASAIEDYQSYDKDHLPTNFNTSGQKFMDKYIALTPKQVADNIKVEMTRAITAEGKIGDLTTRTKVDLVSSINELDEDLGTVSSAMTAGTALGGKTISTGNNTDVSAATAISTLNTKVGVLTSLTTDEKNSLVGAINEVDAHADTNSKYIGTVATAMQADSALEGKTIATGNNSTDIALAPAVKAVNDYAKTNRDTINQEITDRTNADIELQEQIDAIIAKTDVVDVVGTYDELLAYDTTTLGNNDIIKVLVDRTHDGEVSYFRWILTYPEDPSQGGAWNYVGSVSEYYTKSEANARFVDFATDGQTITGSKTFTQTITGDISGNAGTVTNGVYTTGAQTISGNKTFSGTTTITGDISLGSNATATTPAAGDDSTKVATTAWVLDEIESTDAGVVHLDGSETIIGSKTFTQPILRTNALSSSNTTSIKLTDTNNKGSIETSGYYKNSQIYNRTTATNTTANKEAYLDLRITDTGVAELNVDGDATSWVNETASNSTTSKDVAFVGWVNNPSLSTNVVHRTGDEPIDGTKTFTGAIAATGATVTVATQSQGDNSTKAASTEYVDTGLSLKLDKSALPTTSSGVLGQVIACVYNEQTDEYKYGWREIHDYTTLGALEDVAVDNEQNDQSLVFDSSVGTNGMWVNKRPMVATISYW